MRKRLGVIILIMICLVSITASAATTISANGTDPYAHFKSVLGPDPVDGPDSDHITDNGSYFTFLLHSTGDLDGGNTDRQRNEIKVYNSSDDSLKGTNGSTFTYNWKFKIDSAMTISNNFCHLFQIKGNTTADPLVTITASGGQLKLVYYVGGTTQVLKAVDFDTYKNTWLTANVKATYKDSGALSCTLKKDDGTTVWSYSGNIDMWDTGNDFNRPKWGIYRKLFTGIKEAKVYFNNFSITKN